MTYSPSHCCLLSSLATCEMKIRLTDSKTFQLTGHIIFMWSEKFARMCEQTCFLNLLWLAELNKGHQYSMSLLDWQKSSMEPPYTLVLCLGGLGKHKQQIKLSYFNSPLKAFSLGSPESAMLLYTTTKTATANRPTNLIYKVIQKP